jgi:phosphoserine phosphatase RsbU/P
MKRTLSRRLIRYVLLAILPILALIVAVVHTAASRELRAQTDQQARLLTGNTVLKIRLILKPIVDIPQTLASSLLGKQLDEATIRGVLSRAIRLNDDVYGMALGLEPGVLASKQGEFCQYVFRDGDAIRFRRLDTVQYRYRQMPWYEKPLAAGKAMWSEPYFDKGGGDVLMSTYSVPVTRPNGKVLGIVTADISLKRLRDVVRSIRVLETGFAVLLSATGRILVFRDESMVLKESMFSLAKKLSSPSLTALGTEMITGKSGEGTVACLGNHEKFRVVYQPVDGTGWSMGIFLPERELYEPVRRQTRILLMVSLLGLLFVLGGVVLVSRKATVEIHELSDVVAQISEGNLDVPIPPGFSTLELQRLADSFRTMQQSLKEYIQNLIETTASQERMAQELRIARDIQMGILPKLFPPFPSRHDLDLFAMIEPAREVGGDFYDFYFLDESRFCFVIGDVSGKGVPASLFMAVAKTLLKATAGPSQAPGAVLEKVNSALAEGNTRSMFVTVFMGILNLKTGRLDFANGGHNPPLLLQGDAVVQLKCRSGIALGAWREATYNTESILLDEEDGLFCYTDGVNEAFNDANELYGMDRMIQRVSSSKEKPSEALIKEVIDDVKAFAGETPQSDDITMLTVKRLLAVGPDAGKLDERGGV